MNASLSDFLQGNNNDRSPCLPVLILILLLQTCPGSLPHTVETLNHRKKSMAQCHVEGEANKPRRELNTHHHHLLHTPPPHTKHHHCGRYPAATTTTAAATATS